MEMLAYSFYLTMFSRINWYKFNHLSHTYRVNNKCFQNFGSNILWVPDGLGKKKKDNRSNSERQDSYDRTNVGNEGVGAGGWRSLNLQIIFLLNSF